VLAEDPVGDNCFILEDNTIQPFVRIGSNITLWSGNHIGHDSTIEDHCFITSHVVVSGNCTVGAYSFIGVNATLRNSIRVAENSLIAAGAVVMQDTVEKGVYLPQRAKLISKTSDEIEL
jgi:UDP-3-O-[3-hydroxymyristoyl] glucosamine N-acyltransferase